MEIKIDGTLHKTEISGGSAELTRRHYIDDRSLAWKYQPGATLTIHKQIIFRKREVIQAAYLNGKETKCYEYPFGITCWIYSEQAGNDVLKFEVGIDGRETQSFEYILNFKGWKQIAINYERGYMQGSFNENMNYFKLTALSGEGTVYLEDLRLCETVVPNRVYGTMAKQVKNLPLPTRRGAAGKVELFSDDLNKPVFLLEDTVSEEQKQAFCDITRKYLELLDEVDFPPFRRKNMEYEEAAALYNEYGITVQDGIVTGKHITNSSRYAYAMKAIAAHFLETGEDRDMERFIDMWRHLEDQNTKISWYCGRGVGSALLMVREELRKRGLLEHAVEYLKASYNFNRIYNTTVQGLVTNARFEDTDAIGMDLPSTLVCILLMEDSPEKVCDMKHLTYYIENFCLGYAPGTTSGYKPDGTGSHHCGFVLPYEKVANYSISRVLYMLADTPFMVSNEAAERFKNVLRTDFMVQNGIHEPFTIMQYAFDKMKDNSVVEFAHAANAFHDCELAEMYVTLAEHSDKEKQDPYYQRFIDEGIKPLKDITRHKTLTYAAAAFHKRKDWTAAVRGNSKYVYPMEIWPDEWGRYTAFSLFRSYGFLEILYPPEENGGTNNGLHITEGFDYLRWPGCTSVHVPLEQIKSVPLMVEDEWAEWLLSDQGFVGGLDAADENGIFVMKLHGPHKYGLESFKAIKTYHFCDDMILCLGSNITNNIENYRTETTLFQDYGTGAVQDGNILMDNRGNGYWVLPGNDIELFTENCHSLDAKGIEETEGIRTFGILPHKNAPKDEKYGYVLKIGTTMEEMKNTDFENQILVLQQDETAHIVKIRNKTNYVFFRKNYEVEDNWISAVSGACIVSLTESEGAVSLAVCDPDLRFYLGESEDYDINRNKHEKSVYGRFWNSQESIASRIWIVLNHEIEKYDIVGGNAKIIQCGGGKTIMEFMCKDGLTNEITYCID